MEKQTDIYSATYNFCLFLKVLFCLGTFKGAFDVINTGRMKVILSIGIFLGSVFTAILEEFKFDSLRDECKNSAIEYLYLRDKTEDLLFDIESEGLNWVDLKGEFFDIRKQLYILHESSPRTHKLSTILASHALKKNGDNCFSKDEVNKIVPENLIGIDID